jgi:hypothetical protein
MRKQLFETPFHDPDVVRLLLPFEFVPGQGFHANVQRPFRPKGIAIWGAPPGASVLFFVGVNIEGLASYGQVPAKFFAMGDNFEQIAKLLEAGKEPAAWITWPALDPGTIVRVRIHARGHGDPLGEKDGIELGMWGLGLKPLV